MIPHTCATCGGLLPLNERAACEKCITNMKAPTPLISRRTVLGGLAGLVAMGSSMMMSEGSTNSLPTQISQPIQGSRSRSRETTLFTLAGVSTVACSPDGTRIASAGDNVEVWDVSTGNKVLTYRNHSDEVLTVKWSPDGKRIASGGFDCTVQVWSAISGSNILTYRGHSAWVRDLAWSPDAKYIASAGYDKTVQVWKATTGNSFMNYHGHADEIWAVMWLPNGRNIISVDLRNVMQVWQVF